VSISPGEVEGGGRREEGEGGGRREEGERGRAELRTRCIWHRRRGIC
jgi:hypothetical protein